jgi:hypothetical protein
MTQTSTASPRPSRSRRWARESGLPHLAAQLPKDFRSPTAVNGFIYSLTAEVTAGRVESRTAAILGYLSQLAIQTLPLLRIESEPEASAPIPFHFICNVPRPDYSMNLTTPEEVQAHAEDQANKTAAYRSLHPTEFESQ